MRDNQRTEQATRGRAEFNEKQWKKAKKDAAKAKADDDEMHPAEDSRSASGSPRGASGDVRGGGTAAPSCVHEAVHHPVPSGSDSDELRPDEGVGTKSKIVAAANLEHIMAEWLDAFMQSRGKERMVSSMVSGLTEQVAGLTEAQARTENQLERVGVRLSEVQERFTAQQRARRSAMPRCSGG